jgi:FkbM family methyltransferase
MRSQISRLIRRNSAVRTLLDQYPVKIDHLDGGTLIGSRRISQLFRVWHGDSLLRAESVQSLEVYQGGDIIDVGAFHGWYALLLAPHAKTGDSFLELEPDGRAFPELLANLKELATWYPEIRLSAIPVAVGNGSPVRVEWPMGPAGHPSFTSDAKNGVPTVTLDALCEIHSVKPAFVKIDVEGAEGFVLQGMDRVLDEFAPVVMLEVHPNWQPPSFTVEWLDSKMKRHGYHARELAKQPWAQRILWRRR